MALSIGRRLYNLTARHPAAGAMAPGGPRPAGRLVWLHAADAGVATALTRLSRKLAEGEELAVLHTSAAPGAGGQAPPADVTAEVTAFLDHWRPDLLLIGGGEVRPALFHEAGLRRIPLLMANAAAPYLPAGRDGWYPGLMRDALASLRHVMVLDDAAARLMRKAGATSVEVTGRLEEQSAVLPCLETERAAMASLLAARPIWLAADVPEAEEAAVIAAHRDALRLAHRLLLILVPQDPARAARLARQMDEAEGWRVAQRGLEEEPVSDVEVFIPDSSAEYGLWYRLAPITYLGGSLTGGAPLRNPLEAASLGSAIVHGPHHGDHAAMLRRMAGAQAVRAIAEAADLPGALGDLLSPDRSARQAAAAWAVVSEGAEVTERVVALIHSLIRSGG